MQDNTNEEVILQLRAEELAISKKAIQTGQVTVHKELVHEEKQLTIPITLEELVIEKKVLNPNSSASQEQAVETIRIPISEERVEITKKKVLLNEVTVNPHQFEELQHFEETLKKEELYIETSGNARVVEQTAKD